MTFSPDDPHQGLWTDTAQYAIDHQQGQGQLKEMGILSQDSNGVHFGGVHIPELTNIFRHHPARPSPSAGGSNGQHPVPRKSIVDYSKYLAAGGICATITHVSPILYYLC